MTSERAVTAEASITSKNLSSVALLRVAQYPFIALFAMLVPRLMGPDNYGRYALFVSLVGMLSAFLDLGATEISARTVPELQQRHDEAGIRTFFSRLLGFKMALDLSLIGSAAIVALVILAGKSTSAFIWPMGLTLFLGDLGGMAYALLFGLNRLAICSARDPIRRAVGLVLVVVLFPKLGFAGAVLSVVLVEGLLTLINMSWVHRYLSPRELVPNWSFTAPLLRYGVLFYLSWGVTNVWQRLGNTLIGYLRGDYRQIALFDLSNQIFLTATGFTLLLITSLAPIFTRLRLEGKESKLEDWSRRILTYNQIACAAVLSAWLLIGADVVPILIGRQYAALYPNVSVLLCGAFAMVVVQLGLALAMAYAEPAWYLCALGVAVGSFVTSAVFLIPPLGALGCSISTLISCVCCAMVIGSRYRRTLRQAWAPGMKAIAIGGAILLPFWLARGEWARNLLLLSGFLIAYGIALAAVRVVDRGEVEEAWRALRHRSS